MNGGSTQSRMGLNHAENFEQRRHQFAEQPGEERGEQDAEEGNARANGALPIPCGSQTRQQQHCEQPDCHAAKLEAAAAKSTKKIRSAIWPTEASAA